MKIAIVGCAHIHMPSFVKQLKEHPAKLPVAAVWDRDPARAAKYAAELGAPAVPDAETIWRDVSIEAVVIASETCFHRELVIAAAKSGKHLFVEKPLGFTAADAQAAAAKIEAVEVKLTAKVGESGKLYGAVTAAQVAEALVAAGVEVDKKNVTVPEIKELGEFEGKVKCYKGVFAKVKILVESEEVAAE